MTSAVKERLVREVDAEVMFDAPTRGRYATDRVDLPDHAHRRRRAAQRRRGDARDVDRGGGGRADPSARRGHVAVRADGRAALVIDDSKYLDRVVDVDAGQRSAIVEPGVVLDKLNAQLRPLGPVVSRRRVHVGAGDARRHGGNNSCGSRSLAYGNMVDRVNAIDAWLPDGTRAQFGRRRVFVHARVSGIAEKAVRLWQREAGEVAARFPKVARRVAGYNLDRLAPESFNLAKLLVGSEGTLAWFERIHIDLAELPRHKALGVAHFAKFYDAMEATQHIVKLGPSAVELVDRTMLDLARGNAAFAPVVSRFLKGEPDAVLLVEFAGPDHATQLAGLTRLAELMGELGHPGAVVEIADAGLQKAVWEVRKAGLNIMMSMKGDGKPVSFIEDCAVPLEHLAEYTTHLTEVFRKHGTEGTWYAHASVGCLHVRPILNMKSDGAMRMRAIAEEAAELVKRYKGSYSGEHGDGLVRSEWIAPFFGPRLTAALAEIKGWFDPKGLMNPGKIVSPPRQDDRTLFRYPPGTARAHLLPRSIGARGADSPGPWRCATTTATAASSTPARCARVIARPATSATSRAGAPIRCASRSRGSSGRMRKRTAPCARPSTSVSPARAASASAQRGSTWRA
jgi:FAD/FMN-containing dehydrogenase